MVGSRDDDAVGEGHAARGRKRYTVRSAPQGLAVINPLGYHIAKDAHDESLIVTRQIEFGDQPEEFAISFKVYDEKYAMEELDLR